MTTCKGLSSGFFLSSSSLWYRCCLLPSSKMQSAPQNEDSKWCKYIIIQFCPFSATAAAIFFTLSCRRLPLYWLTGRRSSWAVVLKQWCIKDEKRHRINRKSFHSFLKNVSMENTVLMSSNKLVFSSHAYEPLNTAESTNLSFGSAQAFCNEKTSKEEHYPCIHILWTYILL